MYLIQYIIIIKIKYIQCMYLYEFSWNIGDKTIYVDDKHDNIFII